MAHIQCEFFFQSIVGKPASWSESWYVEATTPDDARVRICGQAASPAGPTTPVAKRLGLLHPNYALAEVRFSDVDVLRDSTVCVFSTTPNPGGVGGAGSGINPPGQGQYPTEFPATGDTAEEPWDKLLLRCDSTLDNTLRRMVKLGGLPINVITGNYDYSPSGVWIAQFVAWQTAWLNTVRPVFRYRVLDPVPPIVGLPVISLAKGADGKSLTLGFNTGPVLSAGDYILISGVTRQSMFPVNGLWRIATVDTVAHTATTTAKRNWLTGLAEGNIRYRGITWNYDRTIQYITPTRGARGKASSGSSINKLVGKSKPVTLK